MERNCQRCPRYGMTSVKMFLNIHVLADGGAQYHVSCCIAMSHIILVALP